MFRKKKKISELEPLGIVPLTPEYIESEHGCYVREITHALKDNSILNIALSGNYGVGKSSILKQVVKLEKKNIVELSLSTLAPIKKVVNDESIPTQASTPTNIIQQDIVKQLLYRAKPNKSPGSRFRRIERFSKIRELIIATYVGLIVATAFLLTGWTQQIVSELEWLSAFGSLAHLMLAGIIAVLTFTGRYFLQGRINIREISAGYASVTLDDKSMSYFDQYLDEIVYYFEVSKTSIVIFEDIDRFNDAHIFETLLSLNVLLNSSPNTTKPIRFIYAIKDSIFDSIAETKKGESEGQQTAHSDDPALIEVERANRTKFFDLIIPVVPFISHRSARNLTTQLLEKFEHQVSHDLIDLACKYMPDMRLLKNVCNEFLVFRDRIFSGEGKQLKLTETELFAMMLYKGTHLKDFELIRISKSNIDEAYRKGRALVKSSIEKIQNERIQVIKGIENIDSIEERSKLLGAQLMAHIARTLKIANMNPKQGAYQFQGSSINTDYIYTADFWKAYLKTKENIFVAWVRNGVGTNYVFYRDDFVAISRPEVDISLWEKTDRISQATIVQDLIDDERFLRGADMHDLLSAPDFNRIIDIALKEYNENIQKLIGRGLAYNLLKAGYINRNYTLYTSTFHGDRVSPAATNFIIHQIERDEMDEHFRLEDGDIEALFRESNAHFIGEVSSFNIDIVNYLLRNEHIHLGSMLYHLKNTGAEQNRFLQAFLNSEGETSKLVCRLAGISNRILVVLIEDISLDDEKRLGYVSEALLALSENINYLCPPKVASFIQENLREISALRNETLFYSCAKLIATILKKSNIFVFELKILGKSLQRVCVEQSLYVINKENLEVAFNSVGSLALNVVRTSNPVVYQNVIEHIEEYLIAIKGVSASVDDPSTLIPIINDVIESDQDFLEELIGGASKNCIVHDISKAPESVWKLLAKNRLFTASLHNIWLYLDAFKSIDEWLAGILIASGSIQVDSSSDEDHKERLAMAILGEKRHMALPTIRVLLIDSLQLKNYLLVTNMHSESGELFALLLKHNLIEDTQEVYKHLSGVDWPTRELLIESSKQFINYMSVELIRSDLPSIISSNKVKLEIKLKIANEADEYTQDLHPSHFPMLATFIVQHKLNVSLSVLDTLSRNNVATNQIVMLLQHHLPNASKEAILAILRRLKGDYPKLTEVGYGYPKIPISDENKSLLERLKQFNIVSKYTEEGDVLRITKRRSEK